jgi:hypothetical protein
VHVHDVENRRHEILVVGQLVKYEVGPARDDRSKAMMELRNDIVFWSSPSDWKNQTTTPNASARYVYFNFNTKDGPVVVKIPPAVEVLAVGAVVNPFAGGLDPLASGNGGGTANHGHDVTMPARLSAQDAKTILGVVVGYSLDEACQHSRSDGLGSIFRNPVAGWARRTSAIRRKSR